MDPFLRMIKEAAYDPTVLMIRITIYRLAKKARLVEYLCAAAENGKEVTVLIELRARFDEQNNIDWSERLEEAGCRVIYGFEGYKVHSKICLITYRNRNNIEYITQVGTGNYNEKTATMYTDVSLITADKGIGEDAAVFFKNMSIGNLNGRLSAHYCFTDQSETKGAFTDGRGDQKGNERTDHHEDEFCDGCRFYPEGFRGIECRGEGGSDRPWDLLYSSGSQRVHRESPCDQYCRTLS